MADVTLLSRRATDAATRYRRAAGGLYHLRHKGSEPEQALAALAAEPLLWAVLWDGDLLIECLADDADLDDLERLAAKLTKMLRRRRLALLLEATDGRTPEETNAFLARARQLREAEDG